MGVSLGSWVAGLVTAHDAAVTRAAFLLCRGNAADAVWNGRSTRLVRESIETEINLENLRKAWAPINLENYANKLARPNLQLLCILGRRDNVILPENSESYIRSI